MFCSNCGRQLEEEARYCSACGTARGMVGSSGESFRVKRLTRARDGKRIAGVCAGVARYLELDVTLVRILWILVTIFPPIPGIVAYIVCWIAMPEDPKPVSSSDAAEPALRLS
jgi:phage shock protein C